jgi:hypothetical protein
MGGVTRGTANEGKATDRFAQRSRRWTRLLTPSMGALALVATAMLALPQTANAANASTTHPAKTTGSAVPFLDTLHQVENIASTVPSNGDVNPYGVAVVTKSVGDLVDHDTLVSNFNASSNLQGTGTTIVQVAPGGKVSQFAQLNRPLPGLCPGGIGLTTSLVILHGGYVVVGSLPVTEYGNGTPEAGCLIVLNAWGTPVATWSGTLINGPWDMTAVQGAGWADLFVTNVLNGTVAANGKEVAGGTVIRLDVRLSSNEAPQLISETVIATGFDEQLNSSALVLGPTGDALGATGTLYVADTINNRIAAVPNAVFRQSPAGWGGKTVSEGSALDQPLGLMIAPDGDVIAANGANGNAVEVTPTGHQVANVQMDPLNAGGDLFGLAVSPSGHGIVFVDDGDNTLKRFIP